jgi:hypothetical protein
VANAVTNAGSAETSPGKSASRGSAFAHLNLLVRVDRTTAPTSKWISAIAAPAGTAVIPVKFAAMAIAGLRTMLNGSAIGAVI